MLYDDRRVADDEGSEVDAVEDDDRPGNQEEPLSDSGDGGESETGTI